MSRLSKSLNKNIQSYGHALRGLVFVFRSENNIWYHCIAVLVVVLGGLIFQVTKLEWIAIFIVCGTVFTAEIFNTAIEKLLDFIYPEFHPKVGIIKDVSAAAVLVASLVAVLVSIVIFLPRIISNI